MPRKNENTAGNPGGFKNVLITRFSAFGDVAMTIPVVYSVCRAYPKVNFILATRPSMTAMFVNPPANLNVVGIDLKEKYKGIAGLSRLSRDLCSLYSVDAFADLHNVLRTKVLSVFMRMRKIATASLVKPRAKRKELTRKHNKILLPLVPQSARYLEVFARLGLPAALSFTSLYAGKASAATSDFAKITKPKPKGIKWIGIAPFAAHKGKIYPIHLMRQVVEKLPETLGPDIKVYLLGGGGKEQEILEQWEAQIPFVQSLAGKRYGFAAELALFNHLDAMIAMDSANMHLAAIAGTPTISIWGATHPYCGFKAWKQNEESTIQLPLSCRPCSVYGEKPCFRGDYLCLSAIRPDTIIAKITQTLAK